jgi:hypothetical protein
MIVWNFSDTLPLILIMQNLIMRLSRRIIYLDQQSELEVFLQAIQSILMWLKVCYYLRIWDSTNYLARMVAEVIKDMRSFLLIFLIVMLAFSEAFYFLDNTTDPEHQYIDTAFDAIMYTLRTSMMDVVDPEIAPNHSTVYHFFLYLCVLINAIVMLNLIR